MGPVGQSDELKGKAMLGTIRKALRLGFALVDGLDKVLETAQVYESLSCTQKGKQGNNREDAHREGINE